ncbi:NAD-dependent epimerase/dehydratase family protein [Cellulomonas sp. ACRRI]|uniref:NAD-dependent epimerase/dehydratase family protein n=1 Tax=Cellulomonas sp. ACRRI TaxID=2918188 RepID=UPI001EF23C5C|nr:NAD-dependent epimerase/dehydratase family protein [Cellulomonas sp. ACRRI]MCG7286823.1 NAD-dependent epimerase/dehydratase family protein [Cellulomonas sp. ACRRI]
MSDATHGTDRGRHVGVVGGRGFIGARIRAVLEAEGRTVHVFDRAHPAVTGDGLDPRVARCDHVVWAASSINPLIADNDPDRVALDLEAFDAYLRAVRRLPEPPRHVLLSSGGTVYDYEAPPPHRETSPTRPRSEYGRAKLALERRLAEHDPRGVVLRVANAYGPGQPVAPGQGVIAHWLHALAAGKSVHIFGDPTVARDYVHVDDVARAVLRVTRSALPGSTVLNIGSGRPTSLAELLHLVHEVAGVEPAPAQHDARGFDARSTWLDCGRAESVLGWTATTSLADGIRQVWDHVRTTVPAVEAAPAR